MSLHENGSAPSKVLISANLKRLCLYHLLIKLFSCYSGIHSRFNYRERDKGFVLVDIKELHFLGCYSFKVKPRESLETLLVR